MGILTHELALQSPSKRLNVFERYLTVWVGLCMIAGVLLGKWIPGVVEVLRRMEFGNGSHVNVPIAVLIWLMIIPMLVRVDFGALHRVREHVRGIGVTLAVNWLVKPFSMALLGWIFIRHLFAPWLPAAQIDSYIVDLSGHYPNDLALRLAHLVV